MITVSQHPEKGTRPKVQIKTNIGESKACWLSIEQGNAEFTFMYADADEQKDCIQDIIDALLMDHDGPPIKCPECGLEGEVLCSCGNSWDIRP